MAAYQYDWIDSTTMRYDMAPRPRPGGQDPFVPTHLVADVDAFLARIREATREVEIAAYAASDCDGTRLGDALDALNKLLGGSE